MACLEAFALLPRTPGNTQIMEFEKHVHKFEVQNQCFLIEDLDGIPQELQLPSDFLIVEDEEGRFFEATIRDFYVNGKFKSGIHFDHEEGHTCSFFFEHTVSEGKRAVIRYDGEDKNGKPLVHIRVYVKTHA